MTTLPLPPIELLDQAAATLIERGGNQKLIDKALWSLGNNVEIRITTGGFLIPSSDGRTIYRLDNVRGCSCPASKACYHQQMIALIEEAQAHTMPKLTSPISLGERIARARKVAAEFNADLFA